MEDKQPKPHISVVVLAYNSEVFMEGCLHALGKSRGVNLEVICVDNASKDRSHEIAEKHPVTTLAIRSEKNLGYSGGNNIGWVKGTAPYVVFINPDCRVQPETLVELVQPMIEESEIAICGALLYYPNSKNIQHAGGILHPNGMCEHFGMDEADQEQYHQSKDVNYVTGALIAFHRTDLEELGGFDQDYWPAYYEETDLAWRLRKKGRRIRYVAEAIGYHMESPGLTKNSARFVRTSYRSRVRFIIKNYSVKEILTLFLPFEWKWFFGPFAKGFRLATLRSYGSGVLFALHCLARMSRRYKRGT